MTSIRKKCVTKAFTSSRLKSPAQIKKLYCMKNPLSWWIQQNKFFVIFSNKGFEIWIFEMYVSRWLCIVNQKTFAFKTNIFFWYGLWQVLNNFSTKQSNQFHTQKQSLRKETNKKATISTKTYPVKTRYRKIIVESIEQSLQFHSSTWVSLLQFTSGEKRACSLI